MTDQQRLALRGSYIYAIRIQGVLDKSWADYFGGEIVVANNETDRLSITTLHTPPIDQAALVGLVNRLHGLGLLLLAVEHHCGAEDQPSAARNPQT